MKTDQKRERGSAIMEMAIFAPFLVMLIINVFDISRIITYHMIFSDIVREGVRYGSTILYLEGDRFRYRESNQQYCRENPVGSGSWTECIGYLSSSGHHRLLRNMMRLLDPELQDMSVDRDSLELVSTFSKTATPDRLSVQLRVRYNAIFPLFDGLRFTIEASGPYV